MSSVVLVTGISGELGLRLASALAEDPGVDRVIGVDTVPPARPRLGRVEFVRADIRNPLIAKVIAAAAVDTVVHLSISAAPMAVGGRATMTEMNVIGTMQLLAACQKSPQVRRLVVRSSTAVYGSSSSDPAMFTEEAEPPSLPRVGYAKDSVEIEGYVRGFGRRRPDVTVSQLRFANLVGPTVDTAVTRYFALPVVPTVLGFDPRLQFLHEDDAVEVLRLAARTDRPGTVNVAGDGVLSLSQAIRRAGRVELPIPSPAVSGVARLLRHTGRIDVSPEQTRLLNFGRVVDTGRLRDEFGYRPRFSTTQAFDDFVRGRGLVGIVDSRLVEAAERRVYGLLTGRETAGA